MSPTSVEPVRLVTDPDAPASDELSELPARLPPRWWLIGLLVVLGIVAIESSSTALLSSLEGHGIPFMALAFSGLMRWSYWVLVLPVLYRDALWLSLPGRSVRVITAYTLPRALVHTLARAGLWAVMLNLSGKVDAGETLAITFRNVLMGGWPQGLLTYAAIVSGLLALCATQRAARRAVREAELRTQATQAELRALHMQLHPHFLFNALQAVTVLIGHDPAAARRAVLLLGDLLRRSLSRNSAQLIPLEEELGFMRAYLDIEQTRFAERLVVETQVPESLTTAMVPSFILQPLVENAIRYGVAPRPGPTQVLIRGRQDNGTLTLDVWNAHSSVDATLREGIGLRTTRERLHLLFGAAGQLIVRNEDGGVTASVVIPTSASARPGAADGGGAVAGTKPGAGTGTGTGAGAGAGAGRSGGVG
ncbi:MAG: histidine kinase [Gemmatimonadaceae bacterium]